MVPSVVPFQSTRLLVPNRRSTPNSKTVAPVPKRRPLIPSLTLKRQLKFPDTDPNASTSNPRYKSQNVHHKSHGICTIGLGWMFSDFYQGFGVYVLGSVHGI